MSIQSLPTVSMIFPAKNEGEHVRTTIESALRVKTDYPFEIILVDDGSTDGCCDFIASQKHPRRITLIRTDGIGLARAKNLGATRAKGEYLIFCDAHLIFEDFWVDRLLSPIRMGKADAASPGIAPIDKPQLVGYGQTLDQNLTVQWNPWQEAPFPSAVLPGGCFAIKRSVFCKIGGFDKGFKEWGYEDVEISIKLWLFGYRCYCQPSVRILHLFRQSFPYQISYESVYFNLLRMAYSHFSKERIEKCKELVKYRDADQIEAIVRNSGVIEQRRAYFASRKNDDSWFFQRFAIPF